MLNINLDAEGYFINMSGMLDDREHIQFCYDETEKYGSNRSMEKRLYAKYPVKAIILGNKMAVQILYNNGRISSIIPGEAASKINIKIG
ncbi:MAG: hypothetical protein PHE24_06365 [Patescibacteria group bacterium]|nr:hypothetical protein [Patescibacteria group bacterium]